METIKCAIIKYLEEHGETWGGVLERELAYLLKKKPSNVSRRARELCDDEIILASYGKIDGKGNLCVKYAINEKYQKSKKEVMGVSQNLHTPEAQKRLLYLRENKLIRGGLANLPSDSISKLRSLFEV